MNWKEIATIWKLNILQCLNLPSCWKIGKNCGIQPIRTRFSTYETCHFFSINSLAWTINTAWDNSQQLFVSNLEKMASQLEVVYSLFNQFKQFWMHQSRRYKSTIVTGISLLINARLSMWFILDFVPVILRSHFRDASGWFPSCLVSLLSPFFYSDNKNNNHNEKKWNFICRLSESY